MHYSDTQWELIRKLGEQQGVSEEAMRKWRTRGVPGKWHAKLVATSRGKLSVKDFLPSPQEKAVA